MLSTVVVLSALLAASQGQTQPRIVNGEAVENGAIPYMVSLEVNSVHRCGGSIINQNYVITAASCITGLENEQIFIFAGSVDRRFPSSVRKVSKLIPHEYFDYGTLKNDIALIKVEVPFVYSDNVQPVPLPKSHQPIPVESAAIVSGWGSTGKDERISLFLREANLTIDDQEYCESVMAQSYYQIYPTQICARDRSTRRGTCYGDSGSPLTVEGQLVGIASWSIKEPDCGSTKYPDVYTRVTEYVDWIRINS